MIAQLGGFPERFVDGRVKRDDAPQEFAPEPLQFRERWPGSRQCGREPAGDFRRQAGEQRGQAPGRAAAIGPGEDDAGARDADPDLADARDGQHEGLAVRAAGGAQLVAGDDRGGVARQRRRIGREVAQLRRDQGAAGAPQRQADQEGAAVLGERRRQQHDRRRTHQGADHAEPSLAQRRAETRLAHQGGGGAGPEGVVELEPERDVEGKADGRPHAQPEQQERPGGARRQRGLPSGDRALDERASLVDRVRRDADHDHVSPLGDA